MTSNHNNNNNPNLEENNDNNNNNKTFSANQIWQTLSNQVHRFVFMEEYNQHQPANNNNNQDSNNHQQDASNPHHRRNHHPHHSNNNNISTPTTNQNNHQQQFPPVPTSWVRGYLSETPWAALHTRPTVLTIFISMCVFLPVALWLQTTVLDTTSHLSVFFIGSCFVMLGYYIVYKGLANWSTSFGRLSRDKQIYAVSNLMKASVLASITPIAVYQLTMIVAYDHWDNNTLRNLGCLYAVPDFVSLMLVRRMAATTVIHHICVVLFNFYSIHNDYRQDNVIRLIVVYGAFSTFGYVVYLLLASRFLGVSPAVSRHLSAGALVVYVACCGINWTWQASYLRHLLQNDTKGDHRTSVFVYMVLVSFVMWDDLALNRWLLQNVRTRAHQHQQVAKSVLLRNFGGDDEFLSGSGGGNNGTTMSSNNKKASSSSKKKEEQNQNNTSSSSATTATTTTTSTNRHPVLQPIRVTRGSTRRSQQQQQQNNSNSSSPGIISPTTTSPPPEEEEPTTTAREE